MHCVPNLEDGRREVLMLVQDIFDAGPGVAWVWTGNLNPYYEAKSVPASGSDASLWYYTGGLDPPADKVYFMLLWKKIS